MLLKLSYRAMGQSMIVFSLVSLSTVDYAVKRVQLSDNLSIRIMASGWASG